MSLSPGEHPHADRPNFTLEDYLAMCRDGEAEYSLSEVARLLGVSRMALHRWMIMASVTNEEFDRISTTSRRRGNGSARPPLPTRSRIAWAALAPITSGARTVAMS